MTKPDAEMLAVFAKVLSAEEALRQAEIALRDSIGNILKEQGIEPAPERKRQPTASTWTTFPKLRWDFLGAIDFTTIEVWTKSGLVTHYLLFAMKLATRRVHFAGCTTHPSAVWMPQQIVRNLTDSCEGSGRNALKE